MFRNKHYQQLFYFSSSLKRYLRVSARMHCRIVLVKSTVTVLTILSLAVGVFVATIWACRAVSEVRSNIFIFWTPSLVGMCFLNITGIVVIILDFYFSYHYRNLLQTIFQSREYINHLLLLPFIVVSLIGLALTTTVQYFLESPDNAANPRLQAVTNISSLVWLTAVFIFVLHVRSSCDTGEILQQSLVRYGAILSSAAGLVNFALLNLSIEQAGFFRATIFNESSKPTQLDSQDNPIVKLALSYETYLTKCLFIAAVVGIILLMEPLNIMWNVLQQRLLIVIPVAKDNSVYIKDSCRTMSITIHWIVSIMISGSVLVANMLLRFNPESIHYKKVCMWTETVAHAFAIGLTLYKLARLPHDSRPDLALQSQARWFTADILFLLVTILGQLLTCIAHLESSSECNFYNKCQAYGMSLYTCSKVLEMLQTVTQAVLMLAINELTKTCCRITVTSLHSDLDSLLKPLHYLALYNSVMFICHLVNMDQYLYAPVYNNICAKLYQTAIYKIGISFTILFRYYSSFMAIKYIRGLPSSDLNLHL